MALISYPATRARHDSVYDYATTRTRFEEEVPVLNPSVAIELVTARARWEVVEAAVHNRVGPHGLLALTRLDQGAMLSLSGRPLEATLYLVGNPLIARRLTDIDPAAALYAPFRVAIYRDQEWVSIAYDQPSAVFASLGSAAIDEIATELDDKIAHAATSVCRLD